MVLHLNKDLIIFEKDQTNKDKILEKLINLVDEKTNLLLDKNKFKKKILEREEIGTTGIGRGIVVPHTRCSDLDGLVFAVAVLKDEIEFNTPDDEKAKIILLIGAPKNKNKEYLDILSKLSKAFRNNKFRKEIKSAKSKMDILEIMVHKFEEL
ncbi:MAG: PTS sugar transporter subunit IIA [Fusobacteriota bacterium]